MSAFVSRIRPSAPPRAIDSHSAVKPTRSACSTAPSKTREFTERSLGSASTGSTTG
ncbi:MAG: hypothetical protein QM765_07565 [Myxococcales bacterium]